MRFFIKLGTDNDTPEEPETPDTPPTGNAPLHRGAATEIEEIHQYIYAGGKLLRETISDGTTTKTLDFTYDNAGMPYSLTYNNGTTSSTYYYITNLQGDVMYLVDASGTQVASYDYDPYSKVINATGVQWLRSTPCVTVATITTPKPASTTCNPATMTPKFADLSMRMAMPALGRDI